MHCRDGAILHSSFLILHLKRANFPFTNLPGQFAGSSFSLLLSGFLFFFNRFRINRITFKITSIHFILFIYDFTIYDFTIYYFYHSHTTLIKIFSPLSQASFKRANSLLKALRDMLSLSFTLRFPTRMHPSVSATVLYLPPCCHNG